MAVKRAQPVAAETDAEFEASAKKGKARKAPAPKVKVEKTVELDADGNPVKRGRTVRGDRNHLAREIDAILRAADGPVSVRDIAQTITYSDGSHPSSGAVAAALKRWSEQGYITVTEKPLSFKAFPAKHKNATLDAFLAKARETRLAERRAAKTA